MKLLHLVFTRLTDREIRLLSIDILDILQNNFLLTRNHEIELLGRYIDNRDDIAIFEFDHGMRNGWQIFKRDGIIIVMSEFKNGHWIGNGKTWYDDGRKRSCRKMKKNEKKVKRWHENGQIKHRFKTINGSFHGEFCSWWSNGQIQTLSYHHHGVHTGERRKWNENGEIISHETWENDVPIKNHLI